MNGKLKRSTGLEDTDFLEALERLSGVNPEEIKKDIERTKKKSEKVKKVVGKSEESIKKGARRTKHRFSL